MTNGIRNRARQTAKEVDANLASIEKKILATTTFDWKSLKPELTDQAEYDLLMKIVDESTNRNESIGQFLNRIKAVGASGENLLKKVKPFLIR